MATVLCITGAHRSGTSLTASWLERCGLPVHAGALVPPGEGNPRGHFEDLDMSRLQGGALRRQGLGSIGWGLRGDRFLSFDTAERARARALVDERDARFPVWGWKDPRSLVFLEEWRSLVPDLKVLVVWRAAADVADSLLRRSQVSTNPDFQANLASSLDLWRAFNRLAIQDCRRHPATTMLLPLSRLLAADAGVLRLLEERLGVRLGHVPLSEVYEPSLLRLGDRTVRMTARRAAARTRGCGAVEAELAELSAEPEPVDGS